ncbi:1-phosphatidylinositol phosphodiesterase [Salminus brasiliensis]|uniref:1-phosphatidylinositol phosphodiesterase n=1 Tax=Salminus brasiliensis TaxID=930266 RepID=UPI003B839A57
MEGFNDYRSLHPKHVNLDWMKCIPDDQSLSTVSIPGTHQSLKRDGLNIYRNFQAWKLFFQLYAGVRFFDMTVWIRSGTLYVENNAVIYYKNFADALHELQIYLGDKKSETLLLRLTGSDSAISLAKEILNREAANDLWKDRKIPTMREARGKIILIQSPDFDWGLPINAMVVGTKNKEDNMKANIKKASQYCSNEMMLTDTGAKGQREIPRTVAEQLNKQLDDHLLSLLSSKKQPPCLGIIAMDFPGPKLIQQIIRMELLL